MSPIHRTRFNYLLVISFIFLILAGSIPSSSINQYGPPSISQSTLEDSKVGSESLSVPIVDDSIYSKSEIELPSGEGENVHSYMEQILSIKFDLAHDKMIHNGESWDYLEFTDGLHLSEPGEAMLPYKVHTIETPYEISDIFIEFSNPIFKSDIKVIPAPKLTRIGIDGFSGPGDIDIDFEYYSSTDFLPKDDFIWMKLGGTKVDGKFIRVYSLYLFPCKYNPGQGSLVSYQESEIKILYTGTDANENKETGSDSGSKSSRSSRGTGPEEVKYAIFTAGYLMDELQVLADWKTQKGVPAMVYNVNDVFNNLSLSGRDNPEILRDYIQWLYANKNLEYVLLAGDYDRVPPRYTHDPNPYSSIDDGRIPADIYYACIDEGTTWDTDEDNLFGELGELDDIIPDIAIGRIAINDELTMAKKLKEFIDYEKSPPQGGWSGTTALVGSNVFNAGDGEDQAKYLKNKYLDDVYSSFIELYDEDSSLNQDSLKGAFNDGSSLMIYLGHGSSHVWTQNYGYKTLMNYPDVSTLSNGNMKPVITTVSCDTSWFDAPKGNPYGDCLGESYTEKIDKGAIGYLGSVRTTVGALTQSYYPYSPGLQEDFVRQINRGNLHLGRAYVDGMGHYAKSFGYKFASSSSGEEQACWLEQNLLGEPELPLWVAKPRTFAVENNTMYDTVDITVKDSNGENIDGALISLWLKDKVYEYGYSDGSGKIQFKIITDSGDDATLTVTKPGFIPYENKLKLLDLMPPVTNHKLLPDVPDGLNNWYVNAPLINFSVNEQKSDTYFRWDDDTVYTRFDQPFYSLEGIHTLFYHSVDLAGNTESDKSVTINVDQITPTTEIICDPFEPDGESGWYTTIPLITLDKDPDSIVYYHWDANPNAVYKTPLNGLIGQHTIYFHARDEAGHIEATQSIKFKIDIDIPSTTIQVEPFLPDGDNYWYITKPKISLEVAETNRYTTYYYWDENSSSAEEYTSGLITVFEGEHVLRYYTADEAGNVEDLKWYDFKIDTKTPETEVNIDPVKPNGDDNWYIGESPVISFETSEETAEIYYYWDSESNRAIYYTPIAAPEGEHVLFYYSLDKAGNHELLKKEYFKVDITAPNSWSEIISQNGTNELNWYLEMPNIDIKMDEGGVVYYYMLEETQSLFDFDENQLDIMRQKYIAIYPIEGSYTYYYYAVDDAGNIGDMGDFTVRMDLNPPEAVIEANRLNIKEGRYIKFNASESFDENSVESYKFFIGDSYSTEWITSPELNYTFKNPGTYEVFVQVKDPSGRISEPSNKLTVFVEDIPEDENGRMLGMLTESPMILALLIILIIAIILVFFFLRLKKSKSDWSKGRSGGHYYSRPREPVYMETDFEHRPRLKRRADQSLPPPPPPPPPPSVVKIIRPISDTPDYVDDSDVDWDADESEDDDEIEWEENTVKKKKIKLECPRCEERFSVSKSKMKDSSGIKCPFCGSRGGV